MKKTTKILAICCAMLIQCGMASAQLPTDTIVTDTAQDNRPVYHVKFVGQYYGDHVSLRWAPEEFGPWKINNLYGYELIRINITDGFVDDTLATCIKPLPQEAFDRMNPADSLAQAASFLLYRRGTQLNETQARPGTMESVLEVYEEQQNAYAYGMIVAERRFDLAVAMGLGYVDHTIQPGKDYIYILRPLTPNHALRTMGATIELSTENPYVQPEYEPEIEDSIVKPNSVLLMWQDDLYSFYNIERRKGSSGTWTQINEQPYMSMSPFINPTEDEDDTGGPWNLIYSDGGLEPGYYEYRVTAFDSFGEQTKPSRPFAVELPDFVPPAPPYIHRFELQRQDNDSLIFCKVFFGKDSLENDLHGYDIVYTNEHFAGEWVKLNDSEIAARDTMAIVDVSKYGSGQIAVVAYDQYGNASTSMALYMQVDDVTPPSKPEGLHAMISPEGIVTLMWDPCPERDVALYVGYMSDVPTGDFFQMPAQAIPGDTTLLDTINVRMPQRYKYYKVMAYDYAGNPSPMSDVFQLERLDFSRPMQAHCDSTWQDDRRFGMRWNLSRQNNIVFARIMRIREDEKFWTVLRTFDLDSLAPVRTIMYEDEPPIDRHHHYRYTMEVFNNTGVSSGLALQKQFLCQGDVVPDLNLRISGAVMKETGRPRVGWDRPSDKRDYYFHVYRKYAGRNYRLIATIPPTEEPMYEDQRLERGESATYYVTAFERGGNESRASNELTLTNNNTK